MVPIAACRHNLSMVSEGPPCFREVQGGANNTIFSLL